MTDDPMHYLYDQRDRSGNSPIDQAVSRRKSREDAKTDHLPTTCLKCGLSEVLTTAETIAWMDFHPSKCERQTCPWPHCIIRANHSDDHMNDEGERFTDADALESFETHQLGGE